MTSKTKRRKPFKATAKPTYSLLEEAMASPTEPLPLSKREYQLGLIRQAIENMRSAPVVTRFDWDAIADCTNLLETLATEGEVADEGGWIAEAAREMAMAAKRFREGKALRLTGAGMQAAVSVFEGYEMSVNALPARTIIRTHRLTERRIREIASGKRRVHDIEVVSL